MTKRSSRGDWLDALSNLLAHNKGMPVFAGIGLALASLILVCFPSLAEAAGFWGWLIRNHILLHLGVIVALIGILVGDAL